MPSNPLPTTSGVVSSKHDADCLRRRLDAPFLCTCEMTDAEVAIARESANPHSRAKSDLTEQVKLRGTPNAGRQRGNAPAHDTEGMTSMPDDSTSPSEPKLSIIGRERYLMDQLTKLLADAADKKHWVSKPYLNAHRGGSFEVAIRVDGEVTGHIARVTIELDRFVPNLRIDHD